MGLNPFTRKLLETGDAGRPIQKVDVKELGAVVCLRGMSAVDRASLLSGTNTEDKKSVMSSPERILVRCLVDESGKRIYGDEEIEQLGQMHAGVLDRLSRLAARLSKLGVEATEEERGNLSAVRSGAS